jgi:hypothetical protein
MDDWREFAMGKKLDKSKPYGEVFGVSSDGCRYIQDGIKFGPNGQELIEPEKPNDEWKESFEEWKKELSDNAGPVATPSMMYQWDRVCPQETAIPGGEEVNPEDIPEPPAPANATLFDDDQAEEKKGKKK